MKITFIRPNMPAKRSGSSLEPLAIAILKARTPQNVDLEFYDEFIEDIPEHIDTDLIAMTVQTFTAFRAYQLADKFRKQHIPVVLGGYHPSLMTDEAIGHADAVVIGDAERIWPQVVHDAIQGTLKKFYEGHYSGSLQGIQYDRSIFNGKKYSSILPIEFNRGCTYDCDFCSIVAFNRHTVKSRPINEVIEEIKRLQHTYYFFIDDNICINKDMTMELFKALIPLHIKWGCQIRVDALKDESLVRLMARSGCFSVMVGLESLNSQNLVKMNKKSDLKEDYIELVRKIKKYGIMVWGSFIFGYEHDDSDVFNATIDFAGRSKLYLVNFNTLNPMPGTKLYQRMKEEKRLLEDYWWRFEKYKYGEIMYTPANISTAKLKEACIRMRFKFYKYTNILYRAFDFKSNCRNLSNLVLFLASNIIARRQVRNKMKEIM